jgi:hypothetical protein
MIFGLVVFIIIFLVYRKHVIHKQERKLKWDIVYETYEDDVRRYWDIYDKACQQNKPEGVQNKLLYQIYLDADRRYTRFKHFYYKVWDYC